MKDERRPCQAIYVFKVHDLTMTGLVNNRSSILGKRVLLMFLIVVQMTGEGKKFISKELLGDTLELLVIIIT
jgi:hypothetical protein